MSMSTSVKTREAQLSLPALWCDFNACGLSGLPDDNCYYSMKQQTLEEIGLKEGMRVFGYMEDSETEFVGIEVQLERYRDGWRARPVADSFIYGTLDELVHTK